MRVKGEGPTSYGTLMAVGEGPGIVESKTGRPFVDYAPSGAELSRFFNGLHLPARDEVYITNLFKEWASGAPTKGKEPTAADLDLSEWELHLELQQVKPTMVVALGRWAARWFLGDPCQMEVVHGLLYAVIYCPQCLRRWRHYQFPKGKCACHVSPQTFYVVPVVHPAAGLHNPSQAVLVAYDMSQLGVYLGMTEKQRWVTAWEPGEDGVYVWGLSDDIAFDLPPKGADAGIDTEGQVASPWGWSVAWEPGSGCVFKAGQHEPFTPLGMQNYRWVVHNYSHDAKALKVLGMALPDDNFDDTMLMAYLLGVEPQALKDLGQRHLGMIRPEFADLFIKKEPVISEKTGKVLKKTKAVVIPMDEVDPNVVVAYAGADAGDTLAIKRVLWPRIQALGLEGIYEVDRRVLPLYSRMEEVGLPVNLQHYQEFSAWLGEELELKTLLLRSEYPDLNPGNPDHVAAIMFDHLKLPGGKKTPKKNRFSTNDKIMEALKDAHPFVAAMVEWRELQKIKGTFADKVPQFCRVYAYGPGGAGLLHRLVCQLLYTRVVSGRLAAKNPNSLAFPKYTKLGKRFRAGVQAPPGRLLGSWDLNQIELRVLALDSGSAVLTHAFQHGEDLHERTRYKIFGVKQPETADAQRRAAKEVNFGIPMGITEIGLAEQMRKRGYPFPELEGKHLPTLDARREAEAKVCREWVATVIADWGIAGYISSKHAEARRYGYVQSMGGRIRFLPSVLSPNKQIREGAQREAQAFGPQAGARWFMKQIEARIWREVILPLNAEGPSKVPGYPLQRVEPCLDIHDDLLLEFDEDLGPLLLPLIESMVAASFEVDVPITCKGSVGTVWSEL